jgi:hypothetical protein
VADPQSGRVQLEDGAAASWSLFETGARPALGIAIPATVSWTASALDGPVKIDLSTNYAAFIERWELALYRESDSNRRYPLKVWRGAAAEFDAGVSWDGTVETGPPLRPGETVIALLRVRDLAGNIDEAQPQTMLVSRYLMPAQIRKYSAISRERRASVAAGDSPAKQTIPVEGRLLDVRVDGDANAPPMYVAGLAMDDEGLGSWHLSQILPAGNYTLKVQTERPIIGGTRLVSIGRIAVSVPQGEDRFATVKGTGDLERRKLSLAADGMSRDGAIAGRDAVRLTLWRPEDASGLYTIAIADPDSPAGLYKDNRSRSVVRVRPALREIPWGAKREPRKPSKPVKMRAQFPARGDERLFLPHTDISTLKFFLSVRSAAAPPSYLRKFAHYDLDPAQGVIFLTEAGRAEVDRYREEAGGEATLEVGYQVRPSIAGLTTLRPEGEIFVMQDNGASVARIYQGAKPEGNAVAATSGDQPGWFKRNFGWLMVD